MIALLQIVTIICSRGDVYLLGEAYAFGVVWSFFMKALGVLVLRYQRHDQEYKFPLNIRIGGMEIPVGLGVTTLVLGLVAIANLFSKQIATKYGVGVHARVLRAVHDLRAHQLRASKPSKKRAGGIQSGSSGRRSTAEPARAARLRAGGRARLPAAWSTCKSVLEKTNLRRHDIVVMTVRADLDRRRRIRTVGQTSSSSDYEKELFTHVVGMAEKEGKPVELLVVPAIESFRCDGADRHQAAGVAPGDRASRAHGFRGTGAAHRPGLGEAARAAASVLTRSDQPGPAVDVRQPGSASAAPVAGGCGSAARHLAAS